MSSWWSDVTHLGSFVVNEVKKNTTIYTSAVHDISDAVSDASDLLTGSSSMSADLTDEYPNFQNVHCHQSQWHGEALHGHRR